MSQTNEQKTNASFQEEAMLKNHKITVIGKYVKKKDRILVKCNECGREYEMFPQSILAGCGCKNCASKNANLNNKRAIRYPNVVDAFNKRGYSLLTKENEISSYTKDKLHYVCPLHGEKEISWNNFMRGRGCNECGLARSKEKQMLDFDIVVKEFERRGYTLLSTKNDYKGAHSKLVYLCPIHGKQTIQWANFSQGAGCYDCGLRKNDSKVAAGLKKYCKENYPDTITEYRAVKNPKTGRWMPYDIYIPSEKIFCEVMGEQHYRYTPHFHTSEEDYIESCIHDEIKEDYAQAHGRYVEIDLRRYKTVEQAIKKFEGFHNSWISQWASLLNGKFPEITVENYYGKYGLV